ncbi:urea ABC transporter permease subunit UrtB [soil metagenome]
MIGSIVTACLLSGFALPALAELDPAAVVKLADDDTDIKLEGIAQVAASGDPRAAAILQSLADETLYTVASDPKNTDSPPRLVIVVDDKMTDAITGTAIEPAIESPDSVSINNRIRGVVGTAIAALRLQSPDREVRLAAALELQGADSDVLLPIVDKALAAESDKTVKDAIAVARAALVVRSDDVGARLEAVKTLAASDSSEVRQLLYGLLARDSSGTFGEPNAAVRAAAETSLGEINGRLRKYELISNVFSGISLGSILLLAALGLAITFGLMGIINMAHGEMLMIGAYCTYVIQGLFAHYWPGAIDWYPLFALPFAFVVTAAIGIALERAVIRFFWGRPLETLLATWGISLLLIQSCRTIFGAQNVEVANPSWMSGGYALGGGLVLPYNRIVIVFFSFAVLAIVWVLLNRTRMGLFVRAVTQNRKMASCTGVPTARVDMLTFGLGSGIAGLGGVALSQIGNVGPELGQGYIIDSFMVVVLGGVGQLAGTVIAALGLGWISKFMEPWVGAVLAKIGLLIIVILFIQKKPSGLFAVKGRSAEA